MNRVFVPLTKENFEDFKRGKKWELRKSERKFSPKHVRSGRHVTVSCGYSGERIEGVIGEVHVGTLREIFARIPFAHIEPRATSNTEAIEMNITTLGKAPQYIAFEINLNKAS